MKSPWTSMWTSPRATMRELMQSNPKRGFVWLSFFYGVTFLLRLCQQYSLATSVGLWWIVLISVVLAIPVGMALISLYSIFLFWLGKIIKGKGDYHGIRAATAWANVTQIPPLAIWILLMLTFGRQLFFYSFYDQMFTGLAAIVVMINFIGMLVFGIWGLIIFLHALSEVQKFSFWMALLNVVLVAIALWLVGVVIGFIFNFMGVGG